MVISWIDVMFGAFGLGVLKLLWEAVRYFINRRDTIKTADQIFSEKQLEIQDLFNDLIVSAVMIQEHIEEFQLDNNVSRVLLMKLENGGGIPQLGTVQHVSVLNEAIHPTAKPPSGTIVPVKHDLQDYIIDAEYQRMMLRMLADKIFVSKTNELNSGMMKTLLESSNIKTNILIPVTQIPSIGSEISKGFLIYLSLDFSDDRNIDSKIEYSYYIIRDKIRQIFHEFYVKRITVFDK